MEYYAALSGNSFTGFSGQRIGSIFKGLEVQEEKDFLTLEDGSDTLSRNIGKGLPLDGV
jgi:hypothetical protein